mgnify:CR=1 FL=1
MKKQVLLLFIGLLVSNITFADDNPRLTRCMEVSGGTTIGMIECYGEETNYQDKLLNEFYKNNSSLVNKIWDELNNMDKVTKFKYIRDKY